MIRVRRSARVLSLALLAFLLAAAGSVAWTIKTTPKAFAVTRVPQSIAPMVAGKPIWILLLGDDRRVENGITVGCGCADAVHVIGVPAGGGRATMVNIPRDTLITGRRVNEILRKGPVGAAKAIGAAMGVKIHFVVSTNFDGLKGFVDSIGGVDVGVMSPITDPNVGLNISAGVVHMDGATALAYGRSRKAFAAGDLQRTQNQANLILAVFAKLKAMNAGPQALLTKVAPYVSFAGMNPAEFSSLYSVASGMSPASVQSINVPTYAYNVYKTTYTRVNGRRVRTRTLTASYLKLRQPAAARFFSDIRADAVPNRAYSLLGA